jgi:diguanylate cyclase (GGDEF)-like protein
MKIVYVDENNERSGSIVSLLQQHGHEVVSVEKIDELPALLFNGSKPELVIFGDRMEQSEIQRLLVPIAPSEIAMERKTTPVPHSGESGQKTTTGPEAEKMQDFRNMFLMVQTKYVRSLPAKLEELKASIERARDSHADKELLGETRMLAHKLHGTAGSLGYRQISEPMRIIETVLDGFIDGSLKSNGEQEAAWRDVEEKFDNAVSASETLAVELSKGAQKEPRLPGQYTPAIAKVLIVDEDETFLDVVEKLGRQRMVEVVRAVTAQEALDKACLVALDAALVNVPVKDPDDYFKLARKLRELPGYDNLPLAFVAASSLVQDRVEAAHAGASLFLDKPLESQALEAAVQYLVNIRQGGRPRVLIVDDDPDFCELISGTLRTEGMLVRSVDDPALVLDVMQEFAPELVLLDVNMPKISGFEVCKMVRAVPRWHDLPVIFLTAQTGVQARVSAFQAGADDYLPKPVINDELLARVKVRLDRSRLMKERSDKDTITGLLLRRAFAEQLSAVLAEAQRNKAIFTISLIDVDHFKKVNDTYGHLAGDRVLAVLGQLLARRFRVDDLRGRWGGEEFILAFRREGKATMQAAVTRVLEEFKQLPFKSDDGREFHCTFSGGVASYPGDGESIFDLVKAADERLYRAKEAGRSRLVADD